MLRAARRGIRSKVLVVADHRHRGVGAGGGGGGGLGTRPAGRLGVCAYYSKNNKHGRYNKQMMSIHKKQDKQE